MVFPANTEISIICTSSIKVELPCDQHFTLAANVTATLTLSHRAWVSPTAELSAALARGWHKLPCELKVKVLEYNLISDWPIRRESDYADPPVCTFSHSKTVYAHLAMGPSIAELVPEIFYSRNVFKLNIAGPLIYYPPTWTFVHIRRLLLTLPMYPEIWDTLATLATSVAMRFPKLRYLTVQLHWGLSRYLVKEFMERVSSHVMLFPCAGEVIHVQPERILASSVDEWVGPNGETRKEVEPIITKAITFKE
jgi:hypothetical protein